MKQPEIIRAPLRTQSGGPSPALLRAAKAWDELERDLQLAAVLNRADDQPPRFVLAQAMARNDDQCCSGAVLAECLPGRAAVVMTPQVASPEALEDLGPALLLGLDDILRREQSLLAQALAPSRSDTVTQVFLRAGYTIAGDLLYLAANLDDAPALDNQAHPFELEFIPHSPTDDARWIPLIEKTYLKTLDCPAVDGLRPTREVLAGYRDIGHPRDDWWFIARHEGRDVGCLILADHSPAAHAELVYMGIIPEMRGRGWGVFLVEEAKRIASQTSANQLVLSVDATNTPAVHHYQTAGFRLWEQRTILIKSLTSL